MNDTVTSNAIVLANITGDDLDATSRSFPRIASKSNSDVLRQSLHVGSTSPTQLRVAHQEVKGTSQTRSLIGLKQQYARVDGLGNVIATDECLVNITIQSDRGRVTLAETKTVVALLLGTLTASSGAMIDALYNRET